MNRFDDILELALQLPMKQRAALSRQLLLSLEPESCDADDETLWTAEIEARLSRTEKDNFTASDWRNSLDRIRQSIAEGPST